MFEGEDDGKAPDEDYLFSRKADQTMYIILEPKDQSFVFIQETKDGPDSSKHWGDIRILQEQMILINVKLLTRDLNLEHSPFTDALLETIAAHILKKIPHVMMMAEEMH